jgi:hypothetical protein
MTSFWVPQQLFGGWVACLPQNADLLFGGKVWLRSRRVPFLHLFILPILIRQLDPHSPILQRQ